MVSLRNLIAGSVLCIGVIGGGYLLSKWMGDATEMDSKKYAPIVQYHKTQRVVDIVENNMDSHRETIAYLDYLKGQIDSLRQTPNFENLIDEYIEREQRGPYLMFGALIGAALAIGSAQQLKFKQKPIKKQTKT